MYDRTSRRVISALPALSLLLAAACGDARVAKLSAGLSRDSTLKILGEGGAAGDSLPHVYRAERYLVKGQMIEVLFYTPSDAKAATDTVEEGKLTPVVLTSDSLRGWGWTYYDSVAKAGNIQLRPR